MSAAAPVARLCVWRRSLARVDGIDLLEEGVATATRLAKERGLEDRAHFTRVDAAGRLPFDDETFDAVISIDVMCHLPNRHDILHEGEATFEGVQRFLSACHVLARERRLSRHAYLARG